MSVTFSVIVPIYKVEPYLERCVESILNQSFTDFELLLVDDGSPDNCPQICDYYAKRDKRVRVIHKENKGLVSARNIGLHEAKGEYICYVDGDDWIATDLLDTIYNEAIKNYGPDITIFGFSKVYFEREEVHLTNLQNGLYDKSLLMQHIYPYMMYDSRQPFCDGLIFPVAWNKIYKRELLLAHYCLNESIRMGEDNAFVYECIWYSEKVYICNKALYYYNQMNAGSMVHSYDESRFENNQLLTEYIESRLWGKDPILDQQINAFKAYWLIMAVFHEVKSERPILVSARHIKQKIKKTHVLQGIQFRNLPIMAKGYLILLKLHLYTVTLLASKYVNKLRERR